MLFRSLESGDWDGSDYWEALRCYLKGEGLSRKWKEASEINKRKFKRRAENFLLRNERIYRRNGDNIPQLVVETVDERLKYLRDAHEMTGHRGTQPTFKRIWDTMWWPRLFADVEWHVKSCHACQMRSRFRPIAPLNIRTSLTVFRKVFIDTKKMPKGKGGYEFILHAQDDLSGWPEAKAARRNDSKIWSEFLYELICRIGQGVVFVADNGPEFKGATAELLRKYKIPCILASPYHPQANGVVERAHRTLVDCLLTICHDRESKWPM